MKRFEVGKQYQMRSACDNDCIWRYRVVDRTTSVITLQLVNKDGSPCGLTQRCRITKGLSELRGAESVMPFGRYSMAPVLSADNIVRTK
jgi:hypothetical protein